METRFMRIALLLAGMVVASSSIAAESPELVTAPIDRVYTPLGFDDNDDAEIVLHGEFPNTCFKVGPVKAVVDQQTKKITVDAQAYRYGGEGTSCPRVATAFLQSVKLGPLPVGTYKVEVLNRDVRSLNLKVVAARTDNPDDYLYAPIEAVSFEKGLGGKQTIVLEGHYPYTFVGCMKIEEVRAQVTPGHVLVVQPIAKMYDDDADCTDQASTKKFRVEHSVRVADGEYLAHVRVLAGQSINRTLDTRD
jgi:hypothetical protein